MFKKYALFGTALMALFAASTLSHSYLAWAANTPAASVVAPITPINTVAPAKMPSLVFDRGGMDRASVHLQILQQSNARFEVVKQVKKIVNEEKPVLKAGGST